MVAFGIETAAGLDYIFVNEYFTSLVNDINHHGFSATTKIESVGRRYGTQGYVFTEKNLSP